jgi:hypothetical protein
MTATAAVFKSIQAYRLSCEEVLMMLGDGLEKLIDNKTGRKVWNPARNAQPVPDNPNALYFSVTTQFKCSWTSPYNPNLDRYTFSGEAALYLDSMAEYLPDYQATQITHHFYHFEDYQNLSEFCSLDCIVLATMIAITNQMLQRGLIDQQIWQVYADQPEDKVRGTLCLPRVWDRTAGNWQDAAIRRIKDPLEQLDVMDVGAVVYKLGQYRLW